MRGIIFAAVCGLCLTATAETFQQPAAVDSVTDAAATFLAANVRRGYEMIVDDLHRIGLDVDSARLITLVRERMAEPYDARRQNDAGQYLTRRAAALSAERESAFLGEAAAREGATRTPSGLIIETFSEGPGEAPEATSIVSFNYTGSLPDGTVFDDTTGGEPLITPVTNLVPGMTEGLLLMKAGGRYRLTIPSRLAYGSQGAGGVIPPNTPLQFDIQLIEVQTPNAE